jgi:hypothetical protein
MLGTLFEILIVLAIVLIVLRVFFKSAYNTVVGGIKKGLSAGEGVIEKVGDTISGHKKE